MSCRSLTRRRGFFALAVVPSCVVVGKASKLIYFKPGLLLRHFRRSLGPGIKQDRIPEPKDHRFRQGRVGSQSWKHFGDQLLSELVAPIFGDAGPIVEGPGLPTRPRQLFTRSVQILRMAPGTTQCRVFVMPKFIPLHPGLRCSVDNRIQLRSW